MTILDRNIPSTRAVLIIICKDLDKFVCHSVCRMIYTFDCVSLIDLESVALSKKDDDFHSRIAIFKPSLLWFAKKITEWAKDSSKKLSHVHDV